MFAQGMESNEFRNISIVVVLCLVFPPQSARVQADSAGAPGAQQHQALVAQPLAQPAFRPDFSS